MDAHRACIADVSQALLCGAFAQGERFDNVQVLYIVSKGPGLGGAQVKPQGSSIVMDVHLPKKYIIYIYIYIYMCFFVLTCFMIVYIHILYK